MRNSKISIISHDFSEGGVTRAYSLAEALRKLKYDVEILGFRSRVDFYALPPPELSIRAIAIHNDGGLLSAARQLFKEIKGDIIYAVKPRPGSFGIALIKKLFTHKPVILDIDDWEMAWYGGDEWRYRPGFKGLYNDIFINKYGLRNPDHPLYLRWIEKLVKKADAVTVDTRFLRNRFGGTYLPQGKDTSFFDPARFDPEATREKHGLSQYKVLMFAGAPRPHKGLEDLLAALDILDREEMRLVIVGGNPYDDYDKDLCRKWRKWIIQLPKMPTERMAEVISACHVFTVPQRDTSGARAQFPIKLTEGMAMAKPVLSTRVGDIPEIMGETGYLADPSSPKQLAEYLAHIFDHWEEALEKGKNARERCERYYSADIMSGILSKVIETAMRAKG